jgi:hypothetical protein
MTNKMMPHKRDALNRWLCTVWWTRSRNTKYKQILINNASGYNITHVLNGSRHSCHGPTCRITDCMICKCTQDANQAMHLVSEVGAK